jgi:D-alanyl-D-alanine dipeptidase
VTDARIRPPEADDLGYYPPYDGRSVSKTCERLPDMTPHLNLADPRVSLMRVDECGEPLVWLHGLHPRLAVDDSPANLAGIGYRPNFAVRRSVAERLRRAVDALPSHLSLLVKESLRPLALQERYFRSRSARIAAASPELGPEQVAGLAARFVAPPWVAGHPTGGAIDVTLADADLGELDMGCPYDADETASQGRCFSDARGLGPEVSERRRLMFDVLERAGFVNYPFEWWHWSYGDRYWAVVARQPAALYGAVDEATLAALDAATAPESA